MPHGIGAGPADRPTHENQEGPGGNPRPFRFARGPARRNSGSRL